MASASDIAQLYKDIAGQYRWRILARNGEVIAEGESYRNRQDAVEVLEAHFPNASLVDLTLVDEA
jgi:uncharacterized protein YegP (UPF0339 family)